MEKAAHKELDIVFKRMRERFIRYNPFQDSKLFIRDKIEE